MESERTLRFKLKRPYKEPSDLDPFIEIKEFLDIHEQTSDWTKEDYLSLNIVISNANNESEIVQISPSLGDIYQALALPGWNRREFYDAVQDENKYETKGLSEGETRDNWVITIMEKISEIVVAEVARSTKENKVDSFMLSLLTYLRFDFHPLSIHPQYDYTVEFVKNHHISSKVEYMVTRKHTRGRHIVYLSKINTNQTYLN